MTALYQRKTRLTFQTADELRESGKTRAVIIEAEPSFAVFRLKGTRHRISVSWVGLYSSRLSAKPTAPAAINSPTAERRRKGDQLRKLC